MEFERRVEKFPYQLSEVFELFPPTQEFIRNNGYVDVAQRLTFSLDYGARDIFPPQLLLLPRVFRVFYFILFKNCRKEDPAVLPSKRAGACSTLDIARSKSPFQILNSIFHECIRSLQQIRIVIYYLKLVHAAEGFKMKFGFLKFKPPAGFEPATW